jgi:hypothetical protein
MTADVSGIVFLYGPAVIDRRYKKARPLSLGATDCR